MNIEFKKITIENFKGCENLSFDFGSITRIIGANETGKTTIADAIFYVLSGKNSLGESTFDILPVGTTGLSPKIEIELSYDRDGVAKRAVLCRTYQAKYNRAKEFTGDYATLCFINGAKTSIKEFEAWVDSHICSKDIFNLLTDCKYFTENITASPKERPWEVQRRLLLSICPIKSDIQIAKGAKKWSKISSEMEYLDYTDIGQVLAANKNKLSLVQKDIDSFATQVETLESTKRSENVDTEPIQKRIEEIRRKLAENAQAIEIHQEALKSETEKQNTDYNSMLSEIKDTSSKITEYSNQIFELEYSIRLSEENISGKKERLSALRDKYRSINDTCPTCGQKIPDGKIEESRNAILQEAETLKEEIKNLQSVVNRKKLEVENIKKTVEDLQKEKEAKTQEAMKAKPNVSNDALTDLFNQKADLSLSLAVAMRELDRAKYNQQFNAELEQKIISLEEKHKNDMEVRSRIMQMIDLCRAFISYKCKTAEDKINAMFDGVTFKLFRQNKTNDEIKECCDIFWNGVPYSSLSYSTKFIVSLKIVEAFQEYYGVCMPIIIDNAESIDFGEPISGQVIFFEKQAEYCPKCGAATGRRESDGYWTCLGCGNKFKKEISILNDKNIDNYPF